MGQYNIDRLTEDEMRGMINIAITKHYPKMLLDEAVKITIMAIRHAAHRDGYSGGYINIIHVNSTGIYHIKRIDSKEIKIY